ncbi:MAG TPA: glutamine--fructose-6-phosphate transaminase (isomerizing) [Pirellulaceae bacterium]|nr:glutamine--fructose-6-phosphate transaminase (isomerizing) [Pirellulaceae bacterium]
MCGIVGYVGSREAEQFLVEGLRRLEYRGYDSAGVATLSPDGRIVTVKAVGRIESLAERLQENPAPGSIGIGHTRWATHGVPSEANAHPHFGGASSEPVVALAHNGVIENYLAIKEKLIGEGYKFVSSTDTEAVAHLVASRLCKLEQRRDDFPADEPHAILLAAVSAAVRKLRGTYGLVILFRDYPNVIVAARQGSPLVIGVGQGEHFIASDASPLAGRTDKIVYLADHQVALVTADKLEVTHAEHGRIDHAVHDLQIEENDVELGGFPHYMLKEIFEQPEALENTMRGRLDHEDATAKFGGLNLSPQQIRGINRIILTACGTSWHAALVGEYLIEELARIPVEVEYASELRYRNPPVDQGTLLFAITQSGETADTLAALREMKRKGHPTLAICNVVGSTIAQQADGGVYLHAGPEIGVASTKAYTSQVTTLALLALYFGRMRHLSYEAGERIIAQLHSLPDVIRRTLDVNNTVRQIAGKYCHATNVLYLGRQYNFPTALEGALKLKEISYIHAEGYPAAEMKHGPIALVDEHTPSVFVMPQGFVYDKVMSNLEEIKARGGPVIAIAAEGDQNVARLADDVIYVPAVEEFLSPLVNIIPLQLLAYHIAILRGCDVDKPRNLAKSVTVE